MNATAALAFSLSRRSRLLGRVPRVKRTCVRPQIVGQRKGAITPSETMRSSVLRLGQGTESL